MLNSNSKVVAVTFAMLSVRIMAAPAGGMDMPMGSNDVSALNSTLSQFGQSITSVQANVTSICSSMPGMSGCKSCTSSACPDPLSSYASLCQDMPDMTECASYTKLCSASPLPTTLTKYCPASKALPVSQSSNKDLSTTLSQYGQSLASIQTAVSNLCTAMPGMNGCSSCTNSSCADPMASYSLLCQSMPGMSNCATYTQLCAVSPLPSSLSPYCPSSSGTVIPQMQMFFHSGIVDYVLFEGFVPQTTGQYVGALIFAFALSFLLFMVQAFRSYRKALHAKNLKSVKGSLLSTELRYMELASLRMVEVFISYFMMLIAMTYNAGLFVALLVGVFVGSWAFDRNLTRNDASQEEIGSVHCC